MSIAVLEYSDHVYLFTSDAADPAVVMREVQQRHNPHCLYTTRVYPHSLEKEQHVRKLLKSAGEPNWYQATFSVKQRLREYLQGDYGTLRMGFECLFAKTVVDSPGNMLRAREVYQAMVDHANQATLSYRLRRQMSYRQFLLWLRNNKRIDFRTVCESERTQTILGQRRVRSVVCGYALPCEQSAAIPINGATGDALGDC